MHIDSEIMESRGSAYGLGTSIILIGFDYSGKEQGGYKLGGSQNCVREI